MITTADSLVDKIHNARVALAKVMILKYPGVDVLEELPVELVQAFNILTDMLHAQNIQAYHFDVWWRQRESFRARHSGDST